MTDLARLRADLTSLLALAGLRLTVAPAAEGGRTYDGRGTVQLPLFQAAAHELGHWAAATDEERLLPEWGLGPDPIWPEVKASGAAPTREERCRGDEAEWAVDRLERRILIELDPTGGALRAAAADVEGPREGSASGLARFYRGLAELRRVGALPPEGAERCPPDLRRCL